MSKYEPLKHFLKRSSTNQKPMTFEEVEDVLGFPLPPYARRGASWWSNNPGTHVGVKAWRDAGFRTTKVDIGSGKLVFVREIRSTESAPSVSSSISLDELGPAGRKLIFDYTSEAGGDQDAAIRRAIDEAAIARRIRVVDDIVAKAVKMPHGTQSAVDMIREDRDRDDR